MDRPAISTGPALMIPAGYPRDLPSALLRAARDFGTAGVVEIGPDGRETRLDFPTLLELAARILAGLRANGVRAGDPAVVHCTEPVGFFAAFWACTLGGIRPLLMSPSPEGDTTEEGRERLRKVTDLLGWTVLIGRPSDLPNDLGLPVLDPDALAGHEPTSEFHRPAADDVAVLMMTSGSSTGTPKIIQLTHRGLVEFAAGTPAMLPVRPGQTTLNWLPLDHSGAFLLYHLLPVFTGCTNIHVATDWVLADPLRWLDLMDQHRVNHSWSPNFGYRLAAAAIAGEPDRHWDLSALRSLVSGGEQITVPVVSEFLRLTNRFGVVPETFVAAWGMTETVTGITFGRPGLTPNVHRVRISQTGVVEWVDQRTSAGKVAVARPGKGRTDAPGVLSLVSVGAPAPGATVRIVGPNGAVLPEGRIGQLQIASARVTPGYLGNPDADRAAFPQGNWPARKWLATGDQGFISGGQVVITGRDSERIILNGQTYYAHELEAIAVTAPGAVAGLVAACGVADAALGTERLLIFYALSSESAEGVDEAIRSIIRGRLGLDARVVGVPRRHFPTTPGGKILRPLLKQRWLDNTLETAPGPYATPPVASPYGDPIRPGSVPASSRYDDEDASEQTTELPIVRLAWRRNLQDSIPTPPQRPTLGANRHPAPEPDDPTTTSAADEQTSPLDQQPGTAASLPGTADPLTGTADQLTGTADPLTGTLDQPTGTAAADPLEADPSATTADIDPPTDATDALQPTRTSDSLTGPSDPLSDGPRADSAAEATDTETLTPGTHANSAPGPPATEPPAEPTTTEPPAEPTTTEPPAVPNATESLAESTATDPLAEPTAPESPASTAADARSAAGTDAPTTADVRANTAGTDLRASTAGADAPTAADGVETGTAGTGALSSDTGTDAPTSTAGADARTTAADLQTSNAGTDALVGAADSVPPTRADLRGETAAGSTTDAAADAPAGISRADSTAKPGGADLLGGTAADSRAKATAADAPVDNTRADSTGTELLADPTDAEQPVGPTDADASTGAPTEPVADPDTKAAALAESVDALADGSDASVVSTARSTPAGSPTPSSGDTPALTTPSGADTNTSDTATAETSDPETADAPASVTPAGDAAVATATADTETVGTDTSGTATGTSAQAADADISGTATAETSASGTSGTDTDTSETAGIETGDAETGDAETGDAETGDAETGDAETGDAETGDGDTGDADADVPASVTSADDTAAATTEAAGTETGDTGTAAEAAGTEIGDTGDVDGDVPASVALADGVGAGPGAEGVPAAGSRSAMAELDEETTQLPIIRVSKNSADAKRRPAESDNPGQQAANSTNPRADKAQPAAPIKPETGGGDAAGPAEPRTDRVESAAPIAAQADGGESGEVGKAEAGEPAELTGSQAEGSESAGAAEAGADHAESAGMAEVSADGALAEVAEVRAGDSVSAEPAAAGAGGVELSEAEGAELRVGDGGAVEAAEGQVGGEGAELTRAQAEGVESAEGAEVRTEDSGAAESPQSQADRSGLAEVQAGGAGAAEELLASAYVRMLPGAVDRNGARAEAAEAVRAEASAGSDRDVEAAGLRAAAESGDGEAGVAGADEVAEDRESVEVVEAAAEMSGAEAVGAQGEQSGATAGEVAEVVVDVLAAPVKGGERARKDGKAAVKAGVVEPVAVVGLAGRFPGASSVDEFWENLLGGVESVRRFSDEELKEAGGSDAFGEEELVAVSGALDDVELFDAAFFGLSDREAELTDPAQRLFLEVCQQALEHGGYAGASGRIGIFAGSGMNLYTQQNQPPDYLATRVAYRLGLTGPAIGVQAAWSSSLVAVHLACQALRSGDADLALAGAAAVHVPQATGYHASARSILSPSGHVRAFDEKADGTVGGNGVAAVLLKRLDQAVADGDTVYAVIKGSAVTNDGGQAGQVELVERALEKSGVPAASISYVEANATGTAEDDTVEFHALTTALRKHTDQVGFVTIGSVKPNIGHLDSAAGMAGLIKTVLMLQHRTLVPTINYSRPNPALEVADSPFVIGTEVSDWEAGTPLRAGVSALDAKGTSAHVILEEAPRQIRRGEDGPVVLPISAPDPAALADLAVLFRTELEEGTGQRLIDLAGTASIGRPAHRHRIAVAGSSESELAEALATAATAEVPRGGPGPLGFAFTGQGAARRGMAAGLAVRFPVFRAVLDECDKVYEEEVGGRLLELLLTPAGTDDGVWPTETAQPALFAFELALARLWQSFGVQPALVVGHSVGEYAALCVAGALSLADGVKLTAQRGVLMQRGTVPGAMVAVRADADRVRELAQTPGVEIAAGNGPQNFVLTGSEVIVGQLAEQLDRLELKWQRLDVDRAFHSSLVDPILADFAKVVAQIKLKPLRMPMVSSWSGELLESGTALDGDYLVGQLRQPVLFGDAVEALTAAGCRRFLELGPDAVLSPAGRRIAPNSTWIPTQRLGQDAVLATMNGLAELYEQGTEIAWAKVYPESGRVPLPTYPFRRVHHPVDASARPVALAQPAVVEDERSIERSGAALKRIPLDPPDSNGVVVPTIEEVDLSPFAIPAEDDPDRLSTQPIEVTEPLPVVEQDGAELVATSYVQMVPAMAVAGHGGGSVDAKAGPEESLADADVPVGGAQVPESPPVASAADLYRDSLEVVLDLTGEQLGLDPYDLTVDHTFAELGADSLSMLRVVEEVGQRFDVEIAVSELFDDLNTPHKLATAVASRNQPDGDEVDPLDLLRPTDAPAGQQPAENADPRTALAVLGSGLAELAAKVDAAAAATSEAELPGSGMAALMSQQLRVAGQLVDGVTKLMHEQLALLNETAQKLETAQQLQAKQSAETPEVPSKQDKAEAEKAKRARDLEYWQTALDGAQPLVLPTDRPRPASDDVIGTVTHELNSEIGDAVFAFSRDRRVSPLMTMLAAVGTVLGRFADQDDLVIGTAALRRPGDTTRQPALPLRLDLTGEPDLGDLAQRVREITTTAVDHSTADLGTLEQDPLFQVLVEFEAGEEELAQSLDIRFRLAYHGGGITCTADYRAGLFDHQTVKRLLAYLEAVLRRAIEDPRLPLPDLMLPIDDDKVILAEFEGEAPQTGPVGRVRRDAVVAGELSGLHTLFEQQVARTPDAIALIQGDREISYAELDRRSNAVAWQLVDLGVKPGQLVAVRVARGAELVVAVLAVLKSGAAYLPLDPGVPESRWAFMTADAGAVALVGDDAALADRLGLRLVPVAAVDGDTRSKQAPPVRAAADDIAYCIYTSGSTGNPKGVAVPHRGPVNLIRHYLRTRRSLRTLQWTSFGFDVHVQEMFTALASGAALVLIGEDDRYDPDAVIAALKDHGVERLFMAFTPLTALLATMRKVPELPALREIVAGSEAMVVTHKIRDFLEAHPECTLYNEYGPTEASVVTTIHQVDPDEDRPSIGRPIDGVVVRLLDEALRPVPVGAIGEIHLGGVAVAQGYLGRPDETETAFVSDPAHPGGRLYRSRDLGRWRADGSLDYLGRADDQVKIRGHRVEPGETEHVLADLPGVIDAVVVACADPAGDTCLIGYVVLEDSDPAVLANLLLELTKELPIYLVPADLIPVEDLPLDASGKLDRSRLPEPEWLKGS
ncbi:amino acid adenylation domain-containing protein [Kribbella sp. NPDC051718]|uniref:non-ribosomal peptide synthetase/type I polyketide synthase n=1 Tax=Kribbella sp. NPDC051718 TaxID=3155168 RepID=UPI0034400A8C